MPTATVDRTATTPTHFIVAFRVLSGTWHTSGRHAYFREDSFPAEFLAFDNHPKHKAHRLCVVVALPRVKRRFDGTQMFAAVDWLRDHGWEVDAGGWCKTKLKRLGAA